MDVVTARWTARSGWSTRLPDSDGPSTLVLLFGDSDLLDGGSAAAAAVREVVGAHPTSVVVGCSTAGQVLGGELADEALTVCVVSFSASRVALETSPVTAGTSAQVGRDLGRGLRARGDDLAWVLVLADGLDVNGTALAGGLADGAGDGVLVTGGLAGDGDRFERTWVLVDGRPVAASACAVGVYGSGVEVGSGSRGGWSALGPERSVTRSEGSVLLELDGRPALDLYREYLGERAQGLPGTALLFPLQVRAPQQPDRELVRTVLGVDDETRSMTFAGDVPQGSVVQLMRTTTGDLVQAAGEAAAGAALPAGAPVLALAVSCVGRRLLLGRRTEDELDAVADQLGEGDALVGFYSYGELAPAGRTGCDLHNQTMTVTLLREARA
ncbi:MAG: FIST C-terminal domain-containing protein [Quadrisphaera sp.]